jgi:TatD DNase family protein
VARAALDLGFYISFSRHPDLQDRCRPAGGGRVRAAGSLPDRDRQPVPGPVPYRGKVNSPAYVPWVARQLAEIKKLEVEAVAVRDEPELRTPLLAHEDIRNYFTKLLRHCH